jgi:hypothetical protein
MAREPPFKGAIAMHKSVNTGRPPSTTSKNFPIRVALKESSVEFAV